MAYPFYTIKALCQVFELNMSTYYEQIKPKKMTETDLEAIKMIKQTAIDTGHTYGKRRMKEQLQLTGFNVGCYKVARLMKKANVIAIKPRKRHNYPSSGVR